jgi:hypothetical protein
MKRAVEEDEDEASRQLAFKDAKRALTEASRSVKTKNDSKVHAILNSYYQFYYLPFEQMHLLKKEQELEASQLDLSKQLQPATKKLIEILHQQPLLTNGRGSKRGRLVLNNS